VNRGSVCTSLTATVSPRRHAETTASPKRATGPSTVERRDAVHERPADDELVAVHVRVVDAVRVKMLAEQTHRDVLDFDGISERAKPLVERDQELPLGGHKEA
jgi:hypothetical protein